MQLNFTLSHDTAVSWAECDTWSLCMSLHTATEQNLLKRPPRSPAVYVCVSLCVCVCVCVCVCGVFACFCNSLCSDLFKTECCKAELLNSSFLTVLIYCDCFAQSCGLWYLDATWYPRDGGLIYFIDCMQCLCAGRTCWRLRKGSAIVANKCRCFSMYVKRPIHF